MLRSVSLVGGAKRRAPNWIGKDNVSVGGDHVGLGPARWDTRQRGAVVLSVDGGVLKDQNQGHKKSAPPDDEDEAWRAVPASTHAAAACVPCRALRLISSD